MVDRKKSDVVQFKDMIIEILGEGEISDSLFEEDYQCICSDISKPNPRCPEHGDEIQAIPLKPKRMKRRNTDLSDRYCVKHGLCSCESETRIDEKCPEHGTCICEDEDNPKTDCPEHGKCVCKLSDMTDFECPKHGKCICANEETPHPWCPKHGFCFCIDKNNIDPYCPRHGDCTCLAGTKEVCPVHRQCNCKDDSNVDADCPQHGECICTEKYNHKCPIHGRCICGGKKKFDSKCPKHGPCMSINGKIARNCPEHGQCICLGKHHKRCPKHGKCTCSLLVRPPSAKSFICLDKDTPDPNYPEHGLPKIPEERVDLIGKLKKLGSQKEKLPDDDGHCSCPSKLEVDPFCPQHGQFTKDGRRRHTVIDKPCSCPSPSAIDPYCIWHGKYQRRRRQVPVDGGPCTCPAKNTTDPYCPQHGQYKPDGTRRLICTCDPFCPIHGSYLSGERQLAQDLGPNCTCPAPDVDDPFCPKHGKYKQEGRRRPGAYGLLCTCPSKRTIDPYCREHGKYTANKNKIFLYGPICSCSLIGKLDPYCPEHGSNYIIPIDPKCPRHGKNIKKLNFYDKCTCHSLQMETSFCDKLYKFSPCCKCICDTVCVLSSCRRKALKENALDLKQKSKPDRDYSFFERKDKNKEIRRQIKGKGVDDSDSPCMGTVEFKTKHIQKTCGFTMEYQLEKGNDKKS